MASHLEHPQDIGFYPMMIKLPLSYHIRDIGMIHIDAKKYMVYVFK